MREHLVGELPTEPGGIRNRRTAGATHDGRTVMGRHERIEEDLVTVDDGERTNGQLAPAAETAKVGTLANHGGVGGIIIDAGEYIERRVVVDPTLDPDGTLSDHRKHHVRGEDLPTNIIDPEATQRNQCQDNGVEL